MITFEDFRRLRPKSQSLGQSGWQGSAPPGWQNREIHRQEFVVSPDGERSAEFCFELYRIELRPLEIKQDVRGCKGGMAAELYLATRRKPAQLVSALPWHQECGRGKIIFCSDLA